MISTLALVTLGMLNAGAIEIVTFIDPAEADVAEIDAAVRNYATTPSPGSPLAKSVAVADDYRNDAPHPPVPPAEVATSEVAVAAEAAPAEEAAEETATTPVSLTPTLRHKDEEFSLEGLKFNKPFVVLREEERPEWVMHEPELKGDGLHSVSVSSDPWKTDFEAGESLEKKVRAAVEDYINDQIGRPDAARRIHLPPEMIEKVITHRYTEDLQFSDSAIGAMKQVHAHLVFTPEFRAEIAERWKEHVVNGRLLRTGIMSAGVLALMTMAFGLLKRIGRR